MQNAAISTNERRLNKDIEPPSGFFLLWDQYPAFPFGTRGYSYSTAVGGWPAASLNIWEMGNAP